MKIRFNILSLFLLCALLVSCGTSRQGSKKQRKGMKTQVVLTPEHAGGHHGVGAAALGPADHLAGFFVADGGNGAGIDDISVGAVLEVHQLMTPAAQLLLHGLGLVLVHLAAQRVNGNSHGILLALSELIRYRS